MLSALNPVYAPPTEDQGPRRLRGVPRPGQRKSPALRPGFSRSRTARAALVGDEGRWAGYRREGNGYPLLTKETKYCPLVPSLSSRTPSISVPTETSWEERSVVVLPRLIIPNSDYRIGMINLTLPSETWMLIRKDRIDGLLVGEGKHHFLGYTKDGGGPILPRLIQTPTIPSEERAIKIRTIGRGNQCLDCAEPARRFAEIPPLEILPKRLTHWGRKGG